MDHLNTQSSWLAYTEFKHWVKHACVPVALLVAMLWIPKPWTVTSPNLVSVIQVDLQPPETKPITQPVTEPIEVEPVIEPETPPEIEPEVQPELEQAVTEPAPEPSQQTESNVPTPAATTAPKPQLKATDVMQMLNNRKSIEITSEFEARTEPAQDFYIPKPEVTDWFADVPYLDESVDKPRVEMNFYALGFEGSIERFFDKITVSKTFTTKYGTKIHCALIGILAACSWK